MKKINFKILLPVFFLLLISSAEISTYVSGRTFFNHFAALLIGIMSMFVFSVTKYTILLRFRAAFFYAAGILLLFATFLFGKSVHSCRAWLDLGYFTFQPSEIAKLTTVFLLVYYLGKNYANRNAFRTVFFMSVFVFIPFIFVLKQPDLGTSLVFAVIFFVFLLMSQNDRLLFFIVLTTALVSFEVVYFCVHPTLSYRFFVYLLAALAGVYVFLKFFAKMRRPQVILGIFYLFVSFTVFVSFRAASALKPYQKDRILNFVNPKRDTLNSGYHISQSLITIGSGKFSGKGFRRGSQARLGFLPGKYTDFIFATVCEEFGFVGGALMILAYGILFYEILKVAVRAPDCEGSFLSVAFFGILFSQTVLNIGMNLGILPITGLPLPFVSYGGTALVVYLTMIGIILNVSATTRGY
ncbi:MAG: rod shape-determining protein RodA [Elusimicrobia bacterium]|nr:rod shape-determining protein RodA [Elusimicrobiota bacterium]